MPDKQSTHHVVARNIMNEPIPRAIKRRLLKLLLPGKPRSSRPPRTHKERKRKVILEEFDPVPPSLRTVQDYHKEILSLFAESKVETNELAFHQTRWVMGHFLRGWQMDVPEGQPLGVDPRDFFQGVRPQIHQKLVDEILALNSVKFQLVLKIQLR